MIIESKNSKKNKEGYEDSISVGAIVVTLYVAIAFPLAGNLLLSLILALFLTPFFGSLNL